MHIFESLEFFVEGDDYVVLIYISFIIIIIIIIIMTTHCYGMGVLFLAAFTDVYGHSWAQ